MADLADHSPDRRGIVADDLHAEAAEAEPLERRLLVLRRADAAPDQGDREAALRAALLPRLRFLSSFPCVRHAFSSTGSAAARPRRLAISSSFFRRSSPLNVALMTLCGLVVRSDLVRMSWM